MSRATFISRVSSQSVRAASSAPTFQLAQSRSFMSAGGLTDRWPINQVNKVLNVCPQGKRMVIERLGRFSTVKEPGWFIAVPVLDKIAYVVDMREKAIEIIPQPAITKDNVSLDVSGNLFVRFTDPHRAAYGSINPLYAVVQSAQSAMRSSIGSLELDEILHSRQHLNDKIRIDLQDVCKPWGLEVSRYEIVEISPDREIQRAMDKQAIAERDRREQVAYAEGLKKASVLESEGEKLKKQNESEGELIKIRNEAQAQKEKSVLEAEGEAAAVTLRAKAQADAIKQIAAALEGKGEMAAQLEVARDYVKMYGEMGSKSNTMLFMEKPGDMSSLMAQAAAVMTETNKVISK
jgi:regulator of protease activity HflC (stomatin/prohibitin superfamily)